MKQIAVDAYTPDLLAGLPARASLITRDTGEILYIESEGTRYCAGARWEMSAPELQQFIDFNGGSEYNFASPAGFAFSLWKKHYAPPAPGFALRWARDFRFRFCRDGLYGGRAEVFRYGEFYLHTYDINSAYPWAATTLDFPVPTAIVNAGRFGGPSRAHIWRYEGVAQVVFSQGGRFPVLPVRGVRGLTVYPHCSYHRGIYTHTELRYALTQGVILHDVEKQYIGVETYPDNPFVDFANYCYARRPESDIWKVIANALFGRLAINPGGIYRYHPSAPGEPLAEGEHALWIGMGVAGKQWAAPPESNPLWAAMILAAARNRLHSLLDPGTYYCDTDGAKYAEPRDYPTGDGLGELKHEEGDHVIARRKGYAKRETHGADWKLKLSGESKAHRTLSDVFAARSTQERRVTADGWTEPLNLRGSQI